MGSPTRETTFNTYFAFEILCFTGLFWTVAVILKGQGLKDVFNPRSFSLQLLECDRLAGIKTQAQKPLSGQTVLEEATHLRALSVNGYACDCHSDGTDWPIHRLTLDLWKDQFKIRCSWSESIFAGGMKKQSTNSSVFV